MENVEGRQPQVARHLGIRDHVVADVQVTIDAFVGQVLFHLDPHRAVILARLLFAGDHQPIGSGNAGLAQHQPHLLAVVIAVGNDPEDVPLRGEMVEQLDHLVLGLDHLEIEFVLQRHPLLRGVRADVQLVGQLVVDGLDTHVALEVGTSAQGRFGIVAQLDEGLCGGNDPLFRQHLAQLQLGVIRHGVFAAHQGVEHIETDAGMRLDAGDVLLQPAVIAGGDIAVVRGELPGGRIEEQLPEAVMLGQRPQHALEGMKHRIVVGQRLFGEVFVGPGLVQHTVHRLGTRPEHAAGGIAQELGNVAQPQLLLPFAHEALVHGLMVDPGRHHPERRRVVEPEGFIGGEGVQQPRDDGSIAEQILDQVLRPLRLFLARIERLLRMQVAEQIVLLQGLAILHQYRAEVAAAVGHDASLELADPRMLAEQLTGTRLEAGIRQREIDVDGHREPLDGLSKAIQKIDIEDMQAERDLELARCRRQPLAGRDDLPGKPAHRGGHMLPSFATPMQQIVLKRALLGMKDIDVHPMIGFAVEARRGVDRREAGLAKIVVERLTLRREAQPVCRLVPLGIEQPRVQRIHERLAHHGGMGPAFTRGIPQRQFDGLGLDDFRIDDIRTFHFLDNGRRSGVERRCHLAVGVGRGKIVVDRLALRDDERFGHGDQVLVIGDRRLARLILDAALRHDDIVVHSHDLFRRQTLLARLIGELGLK